MATDVWQCFLYRIKWWLRLERREAERKSGIEILTQERRQKQQPPTSPSEREKKLDYFLGNGIERLSRKWVSEGISGFLLKIISLEKQEKWVLRRGKFCYEQIWHFANILTLKQSKMYFWPLQESSFKLLCVTFLIKTSKHIICILLNFEVCELSPKTFP